MEELCCLFPECAIEPKMDSSLIYVVKASLPLTSCQSPLF